MAITNFNSEILERIGLAKFVAIDLETTGLDWNKDRIIEVGAVRFVDGVETDRFASFVYPGLSLPPEIIRLTGIEDHNLKDAPYPAEILPELKKFLGADAIAAQNSPFDINFLKVEFARTGEQFLPGRSAEEAAFDTAVLSKALVPELETHGLQRMAEHFRIKGGVNHRAEDDARRCGILLLSFVKLLLNLGSNESVTAARILGSGIMSEMFRSLAQYLAETGMPAEPRVTKSYTRNLLKSEGTETLNLAPQKIIEKLFLPDGILQEKLSNYEYRASQMEMAYDCIDAFQDGKYLMAEAGTGTGKSFAYLIPSILFAVENRRRVIISTNTKNLQEQLFEKDLPFLVDALPIQFQAALLKGRNNYICRRKWLEVLRDPDFELTDDERTRTLAILFWMNRTETGDISENNGFRSERSRILWNKVASEAGACSGTRCAHYNTCYIQKARVQALNSHVVVVNHALVLTDLAADNAILGEYRHLILDEAHNLEKAASNHLGREMNIWVVRALCFRLYRRDNGETGLLVRLRGVLSKHADALKSIDELMSNANIVRANAGEYFAAVSASARNSISQNSNTSYSIRNRYFENEKVFTDNSVICSAFSDSLAILRKNLSGFINKLIANDSVELEIDLEMELSSVAEECLRLWSILQELLTANDPDWVYWWELPAGDNTDIKFVSAPLSPAEVLNNTLYPNLESLIYSSATLTIEGKFDYFINRLGLNLIDKEVVKKDYGSPFDYEIQTLFGAPVYFPPPKQFDGFSESISNLIIELGVQHQRGTLVLFTSYSQMLKVYQCIHDPLKLKNITVMAQGVEGSRTDMLRRFTKKRSILLGTSSFWEGVDAPGKALEILVISKLPFDVPTEPLIQARSELIEREGGNPFMDYSVPETVIRLKQGIGRLIRSSTDKGVVLICDTRIVNSRWGGVFRNSLPGRLHILRNSSELNGYISDFFLTNRH